MAGAEAPAQRAATRASRLAALWESVRRAYAEFLTIPTATIAGFLLLAAGHYMLERRDVGWLRPLRSWLQPFILSDAERTADILSTIAGGLITVTSITISLLLLALQQSAGSLSTAVFDQFLRRRLNQFYFGFFVGAALHALITLATVNEPFNPVLGGSLSIVITLFALFLLIVLLYTTINQMRPDEILEAVHNLTLAARTRQLSFLHKTRRSASLAGRSRVAARSVHHGYVTRIDVDAMGKELVRMNSPIEVVLRVSIGSFAATGDVLAHVVSDDQQVAEAIAEFVPKKIRLERTRDIAGDAGDGIEEIETIAWTSISTAKSNPDPGIHGIRSLRDLLARWAGDNSVESPSEAQPPLPIVYTDDVMPRLMAAFEALALVSTESMQHQAFAEVMLALAATFDRLTPELQQRAEELILRALSGLGDHILTGYLDAALVEVADALAAAGRGEAAAAVLGARKQLAQSVGRLNSRSTRAEAGRLPST